jgi:isopenicillin N synthase-like dioxygenase
MKTQANRLIREGSLVIELPEGMQQQIKQVYSAARRFFDLPDEQRRENLLPFGCGYLGYGTEYSGAEEQLDRADTFAACIRTKTNADKLSSPLARELHADLLRVLYGLEEIAEELAVALAALCGDESAHRLRGGLRRWSTIQVSRAIPTESDGLLYHEHEDGHLFSFALADAPGLEINIAGRFGRPAFSTSSIVVMPGKLAQLLTGGIVRPLYHRVRAPEGYRPRLALLYFTDLDPNLCAPWTGDLAGAEACRSHVLSNSARFGVPGLTVEDENPTSLALADQLGSGSTQMDNSGLCGGSSPTFRWRFLIVATSDRRGYQNIFVYISSISDAITAPRLMN